MDLGPTALSMPTGFVNLRAIMNQVTGEEVPMRCEIHTDDLDWMIRAWQEVFELDWRIHLAEQERMMAA